MATAKDIKRRIESVQNVRQITKTMKAVASAKLNKAQQNIIKSRPYGRAIERTIRDILVRHPDLQHSYFYRSESEGEIVQEEDTNPAYLVLTADRGLCAAFNSNIIRHVEQRLEENPSAELFIIGKRGVNYFSNKDVNIRETYLDFWDKLNYRKSLGVTHQLVDDFELTDTTSVTVIYNEFESAMVQRVVEYPLLPLNREDFYESPEENRIDFLYEPDAESVISNIFPRHIRTQVYVAMLESYASEQGARMVAMDNATENANEMIDTLTLDYNQIRQASITSEIAEIVGGAEALKG